MSNTGRVLLVQEAPTFAGFMAEVSATIAESEVFGDLQAPIRRLCGLDTPIPYSPKLERASVPQVEDIVRAVRERFDTPLAIHVHNDGGCAVANSLAAVRAGCVQVQGTINGYGERVGNADLSAIIPDLQLKMGLEVMSPEQLRGLTRLSRYVAEVANLKHDDHAPYVGESAFAHKGGIHVAAVLKRVESYQHVDPALVGNEPRAVVSELSGRGNLLYQARAHGLQVNREDAQRVLHQIKELEHRGFTFEAAEASVDLMLYRTRQEYRAPFELGADSSPRRP